jgi:hypothetical protein
VFDECRLCDQELIYYAKVHADVLQWFLLRIELILREKCWKTLPMADRSICFGNYDSQFDRPLGEKDNNRSLPFLWQFSLLPNRLETSVDLICNIIPTSSVTSSGIWPISGIFYLW